MWKGKVRQILSSFSSLFAFLSFLSCFSYSVNRPKFLWISLSTKSVLFSWKEIENSPL